jgi:hypothetical protein
MYGIPAKRFEDDYYHGHKNIKVIDFTVGALLAAVLWFFLFKPIWYVAPLIIFTVSMLGIFLKIKRRYFIYGALSVVFFPLVLWGGLIVGWAGRNEIKS